MARKTNREVCDEFRALLTSGFRVPDDADRDAALALTKPWRGDLWRAFKDIESRLCPTPDAVRDSADDAEASQ